MNEDGRDKLVFPNGNPRAGAIDAFANGYEGDSGRDPRQMTVDELRELGHTRSILQAIRQNCVECCAGNAAEVRRCGMVWCPMWPFRMGTNPFHTQSLSDEQREVRRQRLHLARQARGQKPRAAP